MVSEEKQQKMERIPPVRAGRPQEPTGTMFGVVVDLGIMAVNESSYQDQD